MNITLSGTKVSMDGHTLAFQKNNLVDSMVITVDTDETYQYKLDVKYPCKDSNGKELYNVIDLTRVGNTCTAILQATMLPFNGKYTMQLRGISGNKVYHTDTFDVWVKYSIDPGKVYDPVPSEFYQIESNITSMNNHPPKPGNNGYWLVWNVTKQEYEESDIPLPEDTLPDVSDSTNGWYLTNDGERVYWAEVQGGSGEGDIAAIQVNGTDQPIVDKVAKLTIDKATVGLDNLDNVRQYSSVNPPPYPVTSVAGKTGDVTLTKSNVGLGNVDNVKQYSASNPPPYPVTSVNGKTGVVDLSASDVGAVPTSRTVNGHALSSNVTVTKSDVGLGSVANERQYSANNQPPYPVTSVAGKTGAVTLTKADVGLGNVDNTSDANKPISTATQTALNGKLDKTAVVDVTADAIKGQAADAKSVYDVIQALPTGSDLSLGITGAQVGQIAKITAVDTDGKPTKWEPVDMSGEEKWEKIAEIIIPEGSDEATALTINKDFDGNPFSLVKARLCAKFPKYTGATTIPNFSFAMLNGKTTGRVTPLAYTSVWPKVSASIITGTVYEIDVSGAQQFEHVIRSGNAGWSDDSGRDYVVYGTTSDTDTTWFGDTLWAKPITSIGGAGMLIYPGCRFVLYGVRA